MAAFEDTLSALLGEWSLERVIEDHLAGASGRFVGTASVSLSADDPNLAFYEEAGRIAFGAHAGPSHRALRFTRRPGGGGTGSGGGAVGARGDGDGGGGGGVSVAFADGRPFFELDLRSGHCEALHPCRADDYELAFELRTPDLIVERWRVRGPAKHYDAETVWRRLG